MFTERQETGGSSEFVDWSAFLRGALIGGVSEGVQQPSGSQAGSRGNAAGTAGQIQYQDRNAQSYETDSFGGMSTKTLLIGAVVLVVGLVVAKKLL